MDSQDFPTAFFETARRAGVEVHQRTQQPVQRPLGVLLIVHGKGGA